MPKTLILQLKYGGLGDHLFYSHIPRIAKETGAYEKVLISNKSELRNAEYKEIIWELNPFVDGFTDEAGSYSLNAWPKNTEENLLDRIMLDLGIDDGKRFHEPELYYKPRALEHLKDTIIYDPNYLSNAGFVTAPKINSYFQKNNVSVDAQFILRGNRSIPADAFKDFIEAKSIYDFMDIIASAKEIYCLVTGTATLACALGRKAHVFYTPEMPHEFRHSKINEYLKL
jgi:hypothetical protein